LFINMSTITRLRNCVALFNRRMDRIINSVQIQVNPFDEHLIIDHIVFYFYRVQDPFVLHLSTRMYRELQAQAHHRYQIGGRPPEIEAFYSLDNTSSADDFKKGLLELQLYIICDNDSRGPLFESYEVYEKVNCNWLDIKEELE